MHEWREKRARKRGYLPTVVPYQGYGASTWVRVLGRVLLTKPPKPGSRAERKLVKREESIRGWRTFTSVPVNRVTVSITIENVVHRVRADRGGVIDTVIDAELSAGWHTVTMRTDDSLETAKAPVFVVDPKARLGVISDVDDTVMVTAIPRPLLAAWNTFVRDEHARVPTPGMAVLLDRLVTQHSGAPMIYLSTGAWNVAPTLSRFLSRNLFPAGALLLTDWGPTHDRWFRSGHAHKVDSLERLADEFPDLRWLLVGDDGQNDERIYGDFQARHPSQVSAVAIRQLSAGEAVLAGGRSGAEPHAKNASAPWVYAPDGAGLLEKLGEAGVL